MRVSTLIGLTAAFGAEVVRGASCSSALKIDNFSQWSANTNTLNYWTSDDASMTSTSAASNVLSVTPKDGNSYWYETMCESAVSEGYNSLQFTVKGPAGGSMMIDLQTQSSCSAATYTTQTYTLNGLTGSTQTITIPFSQFPGTAASYVTGFVWYGYSTYGQAWQFSNIAFGCGGSSGASSTPAKVSSSTPAVKVSSSTPAAKASSSSSATPSKASSSTKASSSSSSTKASSSASSTKASSSTRSVSASSMLTVASSAPTSCSPLLVDDFSSQSRLTFLFYNSLLMPSSDDGSAKSVTVGTPALNRVTIVPQDGTYFYTQFNCVNAQTNKYTGLSLRIKAPKGTTFSIELDYSATCDSNNQTPVTVAHTDLGWTFDGTEQLYLIPFAKFPNLNTQKLTTLLFSGFSKTVSFGPIEFYCGSTGEYVAPATVEPSGPTGTVTTPANTAAAGLVIDKFANADSNALGFWHGQDDGMKVTYSGGKMTIVSNDSDYSWYTQLSSNSCVDFSKYKGSYLHIAYSGAVKFTVSLQMNNPACDNNAQPSPQTWDSAEASRYASNGNIYIPMNHFNIADWTKVIGFAFKGFYSIEPAVFSLVEIVSSVPSGFSVPVKDQTGNFVFSCTRPNSFAFAIDDGDPKLAQQVIETVRKNNIHVTFFTVGAALDDPSTNLTNVYNAMRADGHQIAMHSYTHPKMEGLPDYASIDWEYNNDIAAVKKAFGGFTTKYFRPPFGTEGARMRSRLTNAVGNDAMMTEWSVDVEDWLWAESSTPEQQLVSFQRDVNAGGNLVVMHYLYNSTVGYLQQFIDIAKATNKTLMRVDQCMMDPNAPPLP